MPSNRLRMTLVGGVFLVTACSASDPSDRVEPASAAVSAVASSVSETTGPARQPIEGRVAAQEQQRQAALDVPVAIEPTQAAASPRSPSADSALAVRGELEGYVSGGPPPDGIPALDQPSFRRAADVRDLADDEFVVTMTYRGETRVYPVRVLHWHEIVNDTVANEPVVVTYCPLCNTALAYERRLGDRVLEFGVSGLLHDGALVMFDRQTESLWPQIAGVASDGELVGTALAPIPVQLVAFADVVAADPDVLVLTSETGFERDYGRNPYRSYDSSSDPSLGLFDGEADPVYPPMTRVVGIDGTGAAGHVVRDHLAQQGVVNTTIGGRSVVVTFDPGARSPLDTTDLADGSPIGAIGVFEAVVDGQHLTFEPTDEGGSIRDAETGTTWTSLGEATVGSLAGTRLAPVVHVDSFWFAWSVYKPESVELN